MASTSQNRRSDPKDIGSIGTGMQWVVLNPPFILKPTQVCQRAACLSRKDSAVRPETIEPARAVSKPLAEADALSKQLAGSWTTVSAQKAAFVESAKFANPAWMSKEEPLHPAQRYRSKAVEDLWWPSPFLEEHMVKDPMAMMPPLSWRARASLGAWAGDGEVSPAFWGEEGDERHRR